MRRLVLGISGIAVALLVSGDRIPSRVTRAAPAGSLQRRLEDAIAAREYEATENGQGLQAPNRANGLRTYFDSSGVRVVDRTAADSPELARLTLAGVGRGAALARVAPGELSHDAARVEIRRAGLTEWYENKPEGLEQGFTVETRPEGSGAFALELAISGADISLSDDQIFLRARSGRHLRYGDLRSEDARGRVLPAHLELATAQRVRLVVDDSAATYPIAIDPILTQTADTVLEGNYDDSSLFGVAFGFSVASAGDVNGDGYADLIIGAPGYDIGVLDAGAAFVFLGSSGGVASGGPALAATVLQSEQSSSEFGWSAASAGDVNGDGYSDVIVSAPYYDAGQTDEGAAFVFLGGPAGVPSGSPSTAATVLQGNQGHFGETVASAGDVNGDGYSDVLVGAPEYLGTNVGVAFVYLGSSTGIANGDPAGAATRLTLPPGHGSSLTFAKTLASAGDVNADGYDDVIIGASGYDSAATPANGAAFVFHGGPSGIADATTDAAATHIQSTTSGNFGASVSSAGDVNGDGYADVIVGAGTYAGTGAAFVYLGGPSGVASGTDLTASAKLTSAQIGMIFFGGVGSNQTTRGGGVAGVGDVNGDGYADVIVSAFDHFSLFLGSATGIASGTDLSVGVRVYASGPFFGGFFSSSLAGAGDVNGDGFDDVIIGSPRTSDGQTHEGAALVYLGGGSGLNSSSAANANGKIDSNQGGAQLGASVASAGDVNGDGYADVIVGAPLYDAGQTDEGAAFVFHGGPAGISVGNPTNTPTTLHSNQPSAQFGASVASAGDVNGDGYSDVIVGAPLYDDPNTDEGAALVFLGSASGVANGSPIDAYARFESDQTGAQLGTSVASAGDVNGDGRSDVIVGTPSYDGAVTDEGAAFVFLSEPSGLASGSPSSASATIRSNNGNAQLGASVASAGDVNGDGYGDVIVGAPGFASGSGRAAIFRGSAAGIVGGTIAAASTQLTCSQANAHFGASVAGAGDIDGDGFDDVIVGAPGFNIGAAFIYAGSAAPASNVPFSLATTELDSADSDLQFGASVAGAGDVNGDGFGDVIIGGATLPLAKGRAFLFAGRPGGIPTEPGIPETAMATFDSDLTSARFGASVASAGDVNGDGFADLILGAPTYDSPEVDEGMAFLYYGGGRTNRPVLARQRRGDGSGTPVQSWNDALRGDGFVVQLTGTNPAGRGRVRAQAEACPAGVAFGGGACVSAISPIFIAVTQAAPAAALSVTVAGLLPNTLIHWRARVLRANETGTPSANPAHGPWRRLQAQIGNGDIRTSLDADFDGVADSVDDCRYRANPGQEDTGGFGPASGPDNIGNECQCGNIAGGGRVDSADVLAYRQSLATGVPLAGTAGTLCKVFSGGTACNILQLSVLRRGLNVPALAPLTTSSAAQVCAAALP